MSAPQTEHEAAAENLVGRIYSQFGPGRSEAKTLIAAALADAVREALDEAMLQRSAGPWLRWYVQSKVADAVRVAMTDAREALQFYGRHMRGTDGCKWLDRGPCTCGLEAAIVAAGWRVEEGDATPGPEPENPYDDPRVLLPDRCDIYDEQADDIGPEPRSEFDARLKRRWGGRATPTKKGTGA